jgi:hypothetical protein
MSYIKSALWAVPIVAFIIEFAAHLLTQQLDSWMVTHRFYDLKTGYYAIKATEAHVILDRIFTLSLSSLVFTFGSLLVAIQVAGR